MTMIEHVPETDDIFRTIYEESPIGIELYDREGRLRRINKACARIFGLADSRDALAFNLFADPNVSDEIKAQLKNGREARYTAPFSFAAVHDHRLFPTTKTGVIHIDVTITPLKASEGNPAIGYLVQVQDITDLKGIEEELKRISLIDRLTGLYNRAYFEQELVRIKKGRFESAGIVVCDVDGLKEINDSLGHLRGDGLLKSAAELIRTSFREGDIIARIGGDEFVAIITNCTPEVIRKSRSRIERNIALFNEKGAAPPVSVSLGSSWGLLSEAPVETLFDRADADMYAEKKRKKTTKSEPE
jgi:diguanylate cyclase (GGDEF)-like protein/PAS domain S-box-containing protein